MKPYERPPLLTERRFSDPAMGTVPPARLRVTAHPTVDSFGRATGQPWWVSGATEGLATVPAMAAAWARAGVVETNRTTAVTNTTTQARIANSPYLSQARCKLQATETNRNE